MSLRKSVCVGVCEFIEPIENKIKIPAMITYDM